MLRGSRFRFGDAFFVNAPFLGMNAIFKASLFLFHLGSGSLIFACSREMRRRWMRQIAGWSIAFNVFTAFFIVLSSAEFRMTTG